MPNRPAVRTAVRPSPSCPANVNWQRLRLSRGHRYSPRERGRRLSAQLHSQMSHALQFQNSTVPTKSYHRNHTVHASCLYYWGSVIYKLKDPLSKPSK